MSSTNDKDITHSTINTLLAMLGAEHDLGAVTRIQFSNWKGADTVGYFVGLNHQTSRKNR